KFLRLVASPVVGKGQWTHFAADVWTALPADAWTSFSTPRSGRAPASAPPREIAARARLLYSAGILGVRGIRSWGAGVGLLVGLALAWALAGPHAAQAATCTSSISGPNDPGYAE